MSSNKDKDIKSKVNINLKRIGSRIKEARLAKNMHQRDVARYCKVSQRSISSYETGFREINFELLNKIAEALGTTPAYLLHGSSSLYNFGSQSNIVPVSTLLPVLTPVEASNWSKHTMEIYKEDPTRKKIVHPLNLSDQGCAMEIIDDSMLSTDSSNKYSMSTGDVIAFDPEKKPRENDLVVAKVHPAAALIVRQYVLREGRYWLRALSEHYSLIEIVSPIVEIRGVVTSKITLF